MEYEYKKVEGMSVGEVLQMMCDGRAFYRHTAGNKVVINTSKCGIFIGSNSAEMDLASLRMELKDGHIYTRTKKPWWEGCEGMPVMVRDREDQDWKATVFVEHDEEGTFHFICIDDAYKYIRPLTSAERDKIKVRG